MKKRICLSEEEHGSLSLRNLVSSIFCLSLIFSMSCSRQSGNFHDTLPLKKPTSDEANPEIFVDPAYGHGYNYSFDLVGRDTIVPADGVVLVSTEVEHQTHEGVAAIGKLSPSEQRDWRVRYFVDEVLVGENTFELGAAALSFESFKGNSGYKILKVEFTNERYAKQYEMSRRIYIDEFPPKIFFNQVGDIRTLDDVQTDLNRERFSRVSEDIAGIIMSWNVSDDIALAKDSFFLFSCVDTHVPDEAEISHYVRDGQLQAEGCRLEHDAVQLNLLAQANEGTRYVEQVDLRSNAEQEIFARTYMFYARDKAGYQTIQPLSSNELDRRRLMSRLTPVIDDEASTPLGVDSEDSRLFYSKDSKFFLKPTLHMLGEHASSQIEIPITRAIEENWSLHLARDRVHYEEYHFGDLNDFANGVFTFQRRCGEREGEMKCPEVEEFFYYVRNGEQQSPLDIVRVKYDASPPAVYDTHIEVEGNLLLQGRKVSLDWKIQDMEGSPIRGYQVTIRRLSDLERKLEDDKNGMLKDPSSYFAESYKVFFPGNQTLATDFIHSEFYWGYKGVYDEEGHFIEKGELWQGNYKKSELFDVFISVVDAAGNSSVVASERFYPQVFNAALVTQDVECLFCHLHVYGDIVGINFPEDPYGKAGVIHEHAGEGMVVEGKIIANNDVPMVNSDVGYDSTWDYMSNYVKKRLVLPKFKPIADSVNAYVDYGLGTTSSPPTAAQLAEVGQAYQDYLNAFAGDEVPKMVWQQNQFRQRALFGYKSNYNEEVEEYRVFPRGEDGKIGFPDIDTSTFAKKMKGTLRFVLRDIDGNELRPYFIQRQYEGNIYISGTKENPIQINGEIFINGSLILSGYFEGKGTIYAHNVFIPDDVIALDSPFPFPKPDYTMGSFEPAQERARDILQNEPRYDALYLGAVVIEADLGLSYKQDSRSGRIVFGGPGKYDWGGVYPFKKDFP
ncbi:MAG: hypothetical protein OXT67_08210, partial [Zetaproteobacteria bacterium]|nr:hypothetical protein [Zetaproteobacteria bacterium]